MSWKPLDPYAGPDVDYEEVPTGEELRALVAYYRATADAQGQPHDPEWDRWLREDHGKRSGSLGLAEAARRFGLL